MLNRPYLPVRQRSAANRALFALVGALLGSGVAACAQRAPAATAPAIATSVPGSNATMGTHKRRGSRMMRALRTLGLSDTQKAQIKAARQSYRASRTSRTPETPAQFRAQIENILTPAQRTQFQAAMQRNRRNRMAPTVSPTP